MVTVAKRGANWANAAARSKARKAGLIDSTRMRQLIQQLPDTIAASIAEFGYRTEIDLYADRLSGADLVEAALSHNMDNDLAQVLGFCQGALEDIVAIYVDRFGYQKAKTVLRAIHSGVDLETVATQVLPRENEENSDWLTMVQNCSNLAEAVSALSGTRYGRAFAGMESDSSLMELEDALDAHYYKSSLESLRANGNPLLIKYLRTEIDHRNVTNLFRALRQGMPSEQRSSLMLPGGKLDATSLRQAAQADDQSTLLEVLKRANGFDDTGFEEALEESQSTGSLDPIVTLLESQKAAFARKMALLNPVSAFPVIYYIESKVSEVRNLRLIVRGKAAGLSNEVLEAHVLL